MHRRIACKCAGHHVFLEIYVLLIEFDAIAQVCAAANVAVTPANPKVPGSQEQPLLPRVDSLSTYQRMYRESLENPNEFWGNLARVSCTQTHSSETFK